jgi:hypothetical protein
MHNHIWKKFLNLIQRINNYWCSERKKKHGLIEQKHAMLKFLNWNVLNKGNYTKKLVMKILSQITYNFLIFGRSWYVARQCT